MHNLLGDLEERAGNLVAAAEAYQRASHMDPSEENLFDWGNSLLQLRAATEAGEVFMAAIKRHPRSSRLHVGLGISLYSRGDSRMRCSRFVTLSIWHHPIRGPIEFLGEVYGVAPELGERSRRGSQVRGGISEKRVRALPLRHEPMEGRRAVAGGRGPR